MKKVYITCIIAILIVTLSISASTQTPSDWEHPDEMEFADLEVEAREADKYTLENGLTVYLMEDSSLPLIKGRALIDAGGIYVSEDKVGLAELTARMLRAGGTNGIHPDKIDEDIEYLAASLEFNAQPTQALASISILSEHKEDMLNLFNDILRKPDFLSERIELEKEKIKESIRRRDDNPVQLASQEFLKKMATGHPIGWFPTLESIDSITRDDIVAFHENYYQPQNIRLALSGNFDTEEILDLLEKTLGTWEPEDVEYPEIPEFNQDPEPKIYHVQQPIQQSIIFIGHPAITFDSEEFAPLNFANRVLGAGGDNRLFRELRSRRGLAYAVGSQLTQSFEYPGFFFTYAITGVQNTGQAIELMIDEIEKIREEPITEEELRDNREAILNRAVYRYTSAAEITFRQAQVDFLNIEPDYYERYIEQIQSLDEDRILTSAKQEFRPDDAIIMVVGNRASFDRDLEEFGTVEEIQLQF